MYIPPNVVGLDYQHIGELIFFDACGNRVENDTSCKVGDLVNSIYEGYGKFSRDEKLRGRTIRERLKRTKCLYETFLFHTTYNYINATSRQFINNTDKIISEPCS